jgi:hypothetical protein
LNFSALGLLIFLLKKISIDQGLVEKESACSRFVGTPPDAAILASMSHIYAELDMAHVAV